MKLEIGDTIIGYMKHNDGVERIITEVRKKGYTWKYPESPPDVDYWSENSNDPYFDEGWKIK